MELVTKKKAVEVAEVTATACLPELSIVKFFRRLFGMKPKACLTSAEPTVPIQEANKQSDNKHAEANKHADAELSAIENAPNTAT